MPDDAKSAYDALRPKQKAFVTAYCMSGNAAAAVRAAGYASKWARSSGHALLRRPEIRAALDERRKELKLDVISDELTNMLFDQMRNYKRLGEDGQSDGDSETPTTGEATVVSELVIESRTGETSETASPAKPGKIVKMRFRHSEKLGTGKAQRSRSDAGAEPPPGRQLTNHERAKALLAILAEAKAEREGE
jgi:phage terminase small subunit